ncbi:single-stranded DNA-binding protein [Weissella fangxianensis]|uniref:single-stranded DNA-binding protein n=1 Tax=Weissella fangxianensis TaxID=2953879 RepID=UPI0021583F70|nr:single-stranded DNA-binding protein [Weissella fangxianensis]
MKESMKSIFDIFDTNLKEIRTNEKFSLPSLYGESEWVKLYIGDKVMAGNQFLRQVRQGYYPDVKELPKDNQHGRRQYQKK